METSFTVGVRHLTTKRSADLELCVRQRLTGLIGHLAASFAELAMHDLDTLTNRAHVQDCVGSRGCGAGDVNVVPASQIERVEVEVNSVLTIAQPVELIEAPCAGGRARRDTARCRNRRHTDAGNRLSGAIHNAAFNAGPLVDGSLRSCSHEGIDADDEGDKHGGVAPMTRDY